MQAVSLDPKSPTLSRQCQLLELNRSSIYYTQTGTMGNRFEIDLMNEIHELYVRLPFYGYRRITAELKRRGHAINHKHVQRLMQKMNLQAIYPKPRLSTPNRSHTVYPYLLSGFEIQAPNEVWSTDITYIKLPVGFVYLIALIDWFSRYVVSWTLSTTLEVEPCVAMLKSSLQGALPKIVNSDQGSQFTSPSWTEVLKHHEIEISMDGKGRCMDNILIERLWRTIKYEEVYLKSYDTVTEARQNLKNYLAFYNQERLHQSLGYKTPAEVYFADYSKPTLAL